MSANPISKTPPSEAKKLNPTFLLTALSRSAVARVALWDMKAIEPRTGIFGNRLAFELVAGTDEPKGIGSEHPEAVSRRYSLDLAFIMLRVVDAEVEIRAQYDDALYTLPAALFESLEKLFAWHGHDGKIDVAGDVVYRAI